jgi:hypothetical protein
VVLEKFVPGQFRLERRGSANTGGCDPPPKLASIVVRDVKLESVVGMHSKNSFA